MTIQTILKSWDYTDVHNPQPLIYPVCSECELPYTYSRSLSFLTGKYVWSWGRDCKHRKGTPVMYPPQGPSPEPGQPPEPPAQP